MKSKKITIEELHALADGELTPPQEDRILAILKHDSDAQKILDDIRHSKALLKHAFPLDNTQPQLSSPGWKRFVQIAAVLLLVLSGFGLGWQGASIYGHDDAQLASGDSIQHENKNGYKTIIYIGHSDHRKFRAALDTAHQLLTRNPGSEAEVYVVASAGGIDLMRRESSPYQEEMFHMLNNIKGLRFIACNNTIYRFRQEGKPVDLVAGTDVAPSAVEFVVKHLRNGWKYISI